MTDDDPRPFSQTMILQATAAAIIACTAPAVHDGDTIRCGKESVRLFGVDAPEVRRGAKPAEGTAFCVECGEDIPQARRRALPSARTCIDCQSGRDKRVVIGGINRRGSKDIRGCAISTPS
ncbi:hypothetical protein BH10PSE4_BH10PSE4_48660 [soil metagenome]